MPSAPLPTTPRAEQNKQHVCAAQGQHQRNNAERRKEPLLAAGLSSLQIACTTTAMMTGFKR